MKTESHIDYHVGLMRGYLLAHNAPTQILHALDVLLTTYRSKAGEVIGQPVSDSSVYKAESKKEDDAARRKAEALYSGLEMPKKFFWDDVDDALLENMYFQRRGADEIAKVLNRSPASVSTRITTLGLKKKREDREKQEKGKGGV